MNAAVYLRIITADKDQRIEVQQEPLTNWVCRLGYEPVVYVERGVRGSTTSRPELDQMMKRIRRREFRAVAVLKLGHLGRSLSHLLQLLGEFEASEVRLLIHDLTIDTSTPPGQLFFSVVRALAEFERGLIPERVKDGLSYARAHGTRSGRPVGRPGLNVDFMTICDALRQRLGEPGAISRVAGEFGVSRAWLYKHVVPVLADVTNAPR